MPHFEITTLDIVIVLSYILGTRIVLGWYAAVKARNAGAEGYFLAGRDLRWPIIGLSFYVANMSGSTFVALPASAYYAGIGVYNYEWIPALILVFFIIFVLPHYLRTQVYTVPQFLERRYSRGIRLGFSAFLLAANIFIDAAAALYAGAIIVQTLYPDIPVWLTVSIASLLAGAYIVAGGLRAVVLNDVIQAVMIIIGGAVIAILAIQHVPSWDFVLQHTPPQKLSLVRPADDALMPWPGIFSGVLVIGIYFWCMNQFVMQRALAARSLDHGRWGALFAAFLKLPNLFLLVLPGIIAIQLYPDLKSPDLVFPTLAFDLLPPGWRGLMLASLGAAILSSLEAILNSASTLFTMDFVRTLYPGTSDRDLVRTGKWATLLFMVAAAAWAPQIAYFPTLWQYLQSILSYVTPPIVAIFLLGLFWPRGNRQGAAWTLAVCLPLGICGWIANEILHLTSLQYLYACGLMFLLSCLLFVLISLMNPAPDRETIRDTLWHGVGAQTASRPATATPPWKDYRYLSALLLLLTCLIVATWW